MTIEKVNSLHLQDYYLAQINVGLMKAPIDDPSMAEFAAALDQVNAVAEQSPGFVWRLRTSSGDATEIRAYPDPRILVNMSVWRSVEQLKAYVYNSLHREFLSVAVNGLRSYRVSTLPCGGFPLDIYPRLRRVRQNWSILHYTKTHPNVSPL